MSQAEKEGVFRGFHRWTWDEKGWTETTAAVYGRAARAAERWLLENRKRSLWSAREDDLRAYLFSCKPTARRRNQIRCALDAFLDFLVSEGYRHDNPAKDLPTLKEPRKVVRSLDSVTMAAVWAEAKAAHPMVTCLVALYFWAAIRNAEGRFLRWDQIERDSIVVEGKGSGRRGGRGKERRVPIHPELAWAIRRWRALCPDAVFVFPSPVNEGRPISERWVADRFGELGESLGIRLHPHLLRHTMATEMCDRGANVRAVQELLGHSSLSTTEIYVDVRSHRPREAVLLVSFDKEKEAER
ncbi:MAG: tyrosine-type recombinase/integrase [Actinomycetota bacterium]